MSDMMAGLKDLAALRPKDYGEWGPYAAPSKIEAPKAWKARVKRECPRNARDLIAAYGKGRNEKKWDAKP